jgi:phosphatidylserine/phosphatidylglycerophosphate/cardiolipin synthase-like enzyme/uncharacterized membrane protein YdjX (TVP38/TMEM64 family)
MLYALEREWLSRYRFARRHRRRLAFRLDANHPFGASHHQKVVVVDDAVAFVGGFDLARSRRDDPSHDPHAAGRRDPDGAPYGPIHDVHSMLDGAAARALGDLFRARWRHATGERLAAGSVDGSDPWPAGIAADATDLDVGIARTAPAWDGRGPVTEIRELLDDAIAAARDCIFSETQYFTADSIGAALAARLAETDGPELVSITSQRQCGWLEEATMGTLRARLHERLQLADRAGRYRMYFPHLPGLADACLNVHSKVFIVDDRLLTIGSANISNRSMALDTECNIVIEAGDDERVRAAITDLRDWLLAEHLDTGVERVANAIAARGSAIAAIEGLRHAARSLRPLDLEADPAQDGVAAERAIFDAEEPIDPERVVRQLVSEGARRRTRLRLAMAALALLASCALLVLWTATPLREWVEVERLAALARPLENSPWTPFAILAAYVAGGLVAFPVNVLTAAAILVCGPVAGVAYALAGSVLSAQALYEIGHSLGHRMLHRFASERVLRLRERLREQGLLAIVLVRIVPVAPYSVVNLVAGSARIDRRVYLFGTMIGMLPGTVLTAVFVDRALAAIRDPGPWTYAAFALAAILVAGAILLVRRYLARQEAGPD